MPIVRTLLLLLLLPGCALDRSSSFTPTKSEARLVELMGKRLVIADEVAWIKYSNQLPVRDKKREAEVLERLAILANQSGLNEVSSQNFFRAQIKASRAQQENDIRRWRAGSALPVRPPQSLRDDIRPKIDTVDRELIAALATSDSSRDGLAAFANASFRRGGFCRSASQIASGALR